MIRFRMKRLWIWVLISVAVGATVYWRMRPFYTPTNRLMCDSVEVPLTLSPPGRKLQRIWTYNDNSGEGTTKKDAKDVLQLRYPVKLDYVIVLNDGRVISPVWKIPGTRYYNIFYVYLLRMPTTLLCPIGTLIPGIRKDLTLKLPVHEEIDEILLVLNERKILPESEHFDPNRYVLSIPKSDFEQVFRSGLTIPKLSTLLRLESDPRKVTILEALELGDRDYTRWLDAGGLNRTVVGH